MLKHIFLDSFTEILVYSFSTSSNFAVNKEKVSAYQTPLSTGLNYICSVQMLGNLRKTEQEK